MKFIIPNLTSILFIASFASIRAQDCTTGPDGSATIWNSDADIAASAAHRGDNNMYGMIVRHRFDGLVPCEETKSQNCMPWDELIKDHDVCNGPDGKSGDCGVAASYWHENIKTPNQAYPNGGSADPDNLNYPTVVYAAWTSWDMNPNGGLQGYAFYPTDSNSNDHRDWLNEMGLPGQGCHGEQNFQCTNDGCLSQEGYDSQWCKCNYDEFSAENFGEILAASFVDNDDGFWSCIGEDCNNGYGPVSDMNNLQYIYQGHDYSSCWVDEGDLRKKGDMNMIIDAQNSIYWNSDDWWNGMSFAGTPSQYWGWNEVSFDKKLDDPCDGNQCNQDALIIVLPIDLSSICDVDAQAIDTQMMNYWKDGFGTLPVIVARNMDSNGDGVNYDMEFFTQNFIFESGNCIIYSFDDNNAYYYPSDDPSGLCGIPEPKCKHHCSKGKPCGNSCIPENTSCVKKTRGSACWVKEKCTKFCDAGQACGNSCISKNDTCSKTPDEGFACNKEDY